MPRNRCAENERILTMLYAHAEDCTDLVEHNFSALWCEATVFSPIRKLVDTCIVGLDVEAECRHGDNIALEGLISEGVVLGDIVSEEGDIGRVNAAVIDIVGIADFSYCNTAVTDVLVLRIAKLIQRLAEGRRKAK